LSKLGTLPIFLGEVLVVGRRVLNEIESGSLNEVENETHIVGGALLSGVQRPSDST
jgi:hypothetical protein